MELPKNKLSNNQPQIIYPADCNLLVIILVYLKSTYSNWNKFYTFDLW